MKKLLALVLALVMTLGLATVSSSAALSDFSDGNDVNYEEAMAVMNAVGVFVGDNGKLAPKDNLTRAQAAKIIAYLNLGGTAADSLSKDVTAFTDVPAGNWATGYITYCYNAGIIAGDGTGKFNPNDNVTGLQFAKMLLVTLGYEADREGLVGKDYALNTTKLAAKNELFKSNEGLSVNTPATREEAALYSFNALMAPTYEYDTASTTIKGADGLEVLIGGSNAKPVTTGANLGVITAEAGTPILQLGEKLYKNDLKLAANAATDDMGRPANFWTWKNDLVGKYADEADYTIVVSKYNKTYDEIFDDTSKSIKTDAITTVKRNGVTVGTGMGDTAKVGDIMEVYLSDTTTNSVEYVAITRYSVGKATGAAATRVDGGKDQIRVPGVTGISSWIDTDNYFGATDIAKDDILYYYSDGATPENWYVAKAESFEGQLQGVKTNNALKKYTISGTDYVVNENVGTVAGLGDATTADPTYSTDYRFWTDNNGFVVYGKKLEETNKNYVMIETLKWVDPSSGTIDAGSGYAQARLVKLDGTVEIVKVAKIDGFEPIKTPANISSMTTTGGAVSNYKKSTLASAVTGNTDTATASNNTVADWTFYGVRNGGNGAFTDKYVTLNTTAATVNTTAASLGSCGVGTMLYTCKVNSDGEYELKTAASSSVTVANIVKDNSATSFKASTGKLSGENSATANIDIAVNDSTVFVVINETGKSSPKYTVYTGKNAAPEFTSAGDDGSVIGTNLMLVAATEKSVATAVFVYSYGNKTASGEWIYIASGKVGSTQVTVDGDDYTYNVYKALKSGATEVDNILVDESLNCVPGLYDNVSYDAKTGALTAANAATVVNQNAGYPYAGYNINGTLLSVGKTFAKDTYTTSYNFPADTIVIYKDTDDNFTVGVPADFASDNNDLIYVGTTNNIDNKVKVAYIMERDADATDLFAASWNSTTLSGVTKHDTSSPLTYGVATYTEYAATADTDTTSNLELYTDEGAKIEYKAAGKFTDTAGWTTSTTDNTLTLSQSSTSAGTKLLVKITAADEATVGYYLFTFTTT